MQNTTELNTETTTFLRPVLRDDLFTAYRAIDFKSRTFVPVTIQRSISVIYRVHIGKTEEYSPVTYKDQRILDSIHELFSGSPTVQVMTTLRSVRVRSGWMDKSLSNLEFTPIVDLYYKFVNDELNRKEQQKLRQVLSAITMSKRDMVKCHSIPATDNLGFTLPVVFLDTDFKEVSKNKFTVTPQRLETQNANPI